MTTPGGYSGYVWAVLTLQTLLCFLGVRALLACDRRALWMYVQKMMEARSKLTSSKPSLECQLSEHIAASRQYLVRLMCKLIIGYSTAYLTIVQINLLRGGTPASTSVSAWSIFALVFLILLLLVKEKVNVDIMFSGLMLYEIFCMSHWHVPNLVDLIVLSWIYAMPRLCLGLAAERTWVVVFWNTIHSLFVLFRLYSEVFQSQYALCLVDRFGAASVWQLEFLCYVATLSTIIGIRGCWRMIVSLRFETKEKTTEIDMTRALLTGLFDAVVDVDDHLNFMELSSKLASLLRTQPEVLMRSNLISLFVPDEMDRVKKHLSAPHTFLIRSKMLDVDGNHKDVELVHVYRREGGSAPRTLVGIREVSLMDAIDCGSPAIVVAAGPSVSTAPSINTDVLPEVVFDALTLEILAANDHFDRMVGPSLGACLDDKFSYRENEGFYENLQKVQKKARHLPDGSRSVPANVGKLHVRTPTNGTVVVQRDSDADGGVVAVLTLRPGEAAEGRCEQTASDGPELANTRWRFRQYL